MSLVDVISVDSYRTSDLKNWKSIVATWIRLKSEKGLEVAIGLKSLKGNGTVAQWKMVKEGFKYYRDRVTGVRRNTLFDSTAEAAMLFQLRDSPNVIRLLGWCDTTVVMERGVSALADFIETEDVSVSDALLMALEMVKGVEQLHSVSGGPIAHLDIKSENFLFNAQGKLVVNDINMSRYTGNSSNNKKCQYPGFVHGSLPSPEELNKQPVDERADIYSTAIVMWQLRSPMRFAFDAIKEKRDRWIAEGHRPDVTKMSDYPREMQDLIVQAWDADPAKRPTASEMVQRIEAIISDYDSDQVSHPNTTSYELLEN